MNEEVKIQTELSVGQASLKEALKWMSIMGGFSLATILSVMVWFNTQQLDIGKSLTRLKSQVFYLDKDVKKHLDITH